MAPTGGSNPNADDLLVLLAVARLGRFTAAADVLGVNHTTVSRRIAVLERAVGGRVLVQTPGGWELSDLGRRVLPVAEEIERAMQSLAVAAGGAEEVRGTVRVASPDGFSIHVVVPAAAALHREHPGIDCELIAATQRLRHHRSGVDIEIVVGEPPVHKAIAVRLGQYALALYATEEYLARAGVPESVGDLARHTLVYYIESALQVDDLDMATRGLPAPAGSLASTSVFAHVETTLASGGIGLLPDYMAAMHPRLRRVVPGFEHPLSYWAVLREEALRSRPVHLMLNQIRRQGARTVSPDAQPPAR
ncbi:LysR family transcriptional regulator [Naumannella huperziae]